MPSFDTPVRDILSGDGTQVFTPMTEAMDANAFRKVRFRLWGAAQAPASIEVYVAVQFSDNGVDWEFGSNPPVALGYSGTLLTETWNWTSFDTWKDVFGVSGTKRLFVRFGLLAKSASASRPGSPSLSRGASSPRTSRRRPVGRPRSGRTALRCPESRPQNPPDPLTRTRVRLE